MMRHRDERVRLQSEMIRGVGEIKLASWEVPLLVKVREAREAELDALAKRKYLDAMCVYLWAATPVLVSLATFATAVLIDPSAGDAGAGSKHTNGALSAATVFSAIALLNMLVFPMNAAPWILAGCLEAAVSIRRLGRFLLATEEGYGLGPSALGSSRGLMPSSPSRQSPAAVRVQGSFTWPAIVRRAQSRSLAASKSRGGTLPTAGPEGRVCVLPVYAPTDFLLRDIHLTIPREAVVVVVGKVGSGKTALLNCLLGEMAGVDTSSSGRLSSPHRAPPGGSSSVAWSDRIALGDGKRPRCALVTQTPWVREGTIRENITMLPASTPRQLDHLAKVLHDAGLSSDSDIDAPVFDEKRYRYALWASCLQEDLVGMPRGDKTHVGSRGIRLSGGQKARVAIARALYSRAPLLVIDDALRALDANVASRVRERAFAVRHHQQGVSPSEDDPPIDLSSAEDGPSMAAQLGRTVVLSTNDSSCVSSTFCSRVIALDRGRIIYDGEPDQMPGDVAEAAGLLNRRDSDSAAGQDRSASQVDLTEAAYSSSSVRDSAASCDD